MRLELGDKERKTNFRLRDDSGNVNIKETVKYEIVTCFVQASTRLGGNMFLKNITK